MNDQVKQSDPVKPEKWQARNGGVWTGAGGGSYSVDDLSAKLIARDANNAIDAAYEAGIAEGRQIEKALESLGLRRLSRRLMDGWEPVTFRREQLIVTQQGDDRWYVEDEHNGSFLGPGGVWVGFVHRETFTNSVQAIQTATQAWVTMPQEAKRSCP